jgi:hypothetical protein
MKTYLKVLMLTMAIFVVCNVVNGEPVSGIKTIGGTSPDYADIKTAIAFLKALTINGDVILNIRDGVYNEKFEISGIEGTDKYSITFQSESQDTAKVKIVYTATAQYDHMVKLTQIKNISFNHISFHYTGYDYTCHMFHMYDNATKVKFENNNFKSFNANSYVIYAPEALSSEVSVDTIQINNNKFVSGSCGVFLHGGSYGIVDSVVINNNIFLNQKSRGIELSSCQGITIKSNAITSNACSTPSSDFFGIGLMYGKNFEISNNNINANFGAGILLDDCVNTAAFKRLISNNTVTIKPALDNWTGGPISINNSTYVDIIHNTFRRIGIESGFSKSGLSISGSSNLNVINNIIYNKDSYSVMLSSNTALTSNYNYIFSGSQYFAYFNSTLCTSFDEWKTTSSLDASSVSGTIAFMSETDSHIKITDASNVLIDNKGTQWSAVTKDIDNETRNNPPDIGADEFTIPNEAPVINNQTFSVTENSANGTAVGTVVASDADAGQTLTYSITAGNTSNAFAINSSTGALTVNTSSVLNYEAVTSFALTVKVQDNGAGTKSSTATITVNITNVNEAPALTGQTFSLAENSANGTAVGTVTGSDPDAGQTVAYSITAGNTSDAFAINASSGAITVNNASALNYESSSSFALTVTVQDNGTPALTGSATVTVNLTNVNEAPVISNQTFSISEASTNGAAVGTVAASDPESSALTYSITAGNTSDAFAINAATGAITVSNASVLNYTTTPSYSLTVNVQENVGGTLSASATITINVTKKNETPVISNQTFSIKEHSADGTAVGAVVASDPDAGQTLTYSITAGNELNAFAINGATGAITVSKSSALDFNTTPSFALTVKVQDNGTIALSASATITVNLTKATGVNSLSNEKAGYIYPNPSYGIININPELFKDGKVGIEIFDMNGKLILRKENISESNPVEISQTGIFNVNLIVNNKVYSQRIIISR